MFLGPGQKQEVVLALQPLIEVRDPLPPHMAPSATCPPPLRSAIPTGLSMNICSLCSAAHGKEVDRQWKARERRCYKTSRAPANTLWGP